MSTESRSPRSIRSLFSLCFLSITNSVTSSTGSVIIRHEAISERNNRRFTHKMYLECFLCYINPELLAPSKSIAPRKIICLLDSEVIKFLPWERNRPNRPPAKNFDQSIQKYRAESGEAYHSLALSCSTYQKLIPVLSGGTRKFSCAILTF
jgi:hypothetical protein